MDKTHNLEMDDKYIQKLDSDEEELRVDDETEALEHEDRNGAAAGVGGDNGRVRDVLSQSLNHFLSASGGGIALE